MKRFCQSILRETFRKLLFDRVDAAIADMNNKGYTVQPVEGWKFIFDLIDSLVPKMGSR